MRDGIFNDTKSSHGMENLIANFVVNIGVALFNTGESLGCGFRINWRLMPSTQIGEESTSNSATSSALYAAIASVRDHFHRWNPNCYGSVWNRRLPSYRPTFNHHHGMSRDESGHCTSPDERHQHSNGRTHAEWHRLHRLLQWRNR